MWNLHYSEKSCNEKLPVQRNIHDKKSGFIRNCKKQETITIYVIFHDLLPALFLNVVCRPASIITKEEAFCLKTIIPQENLVSFWEQVSKKPGNPLPGLNSPCHKIFLSCQGFIRYANEPLRGCGLDRQKTCGFLWLSQAKDKSGRMATLFHTFRVFLRSVTFSWVTPWWVSHNPIKSHFCYSRFSHTRCQHNVLRQ